MSGRIGTTEMYLRIILELEEEGVVPRRAGLAERLHRSGPAVSQTVARMERDGLLHVAADRRLELTAEGRRIATRVLRRHRLAECLLVEVIGLEWEHVHAEAARWEHVMSEAVERRFLELLRHPTASPYGNPIPGLEELGGTSSNLDETTLSLSALKPGPGGASALVHRIGERIQADTRLLNSLRRAGVRPGAVVRVRPSPHGVFVGTGGETAELRPPTASHVYVVKR
ncbi:metal-dependent transcriptional regulator [Amycolatopsis sp. ATCC 39116]|uniref:metal-dependent transcriptional regulator n=1 Tax=Amycolatopsis sp. (strain ATCC 39116 / 75iv2) TaxID=385957 RepID=UPI0002628C8B|nr:metal-dependent transcriptional regulator [Amycolatopsis sp. ATCC 39116]